MKPCCKFHADEAAIARAFHRRLGWELLLTTRYTIERVAAMIIGYYIARRLLGL
jgi:regulator of PEP synthase PpsR (kinase-PPPase family)